MAICGTDAAVLEPVLQKIVALVRREREAELADFSVEWR